MSPWGRVRVNARTAWLMARWVRALRRRGVPWVGMPDRFARLGGRVRAAGGGQAQVDAGRAALAAMHLDIIRGHAAAATALPRMRAGDVLCSCGATFTGPLAEQQAVAHDDAHDDQAAGHEDGPGGMWERCDYCDVLAGHLLTCARRADALR